MAKRGLSEEIIAIEAAHLAAEQGLDALTLQALAQRLGVRPSSLYNHVDGLGGVMRAMAKLSMRRLEAAIRDAAVGLTQEDALRAIAHAYRSFAHEHPQLYKAYIRSASLEDPALDEAARSIVRVMNQVMNAYPAMTQEDRTHFIRGFRSLLHGYISLEEAGFFMGNTDVDLSFHKAVEGYIYANKNTTKEQS